MKYEIAQDLIIVGGGGLLMIAGVISHDPVNIVVAGLFFLFGLATLYADVRRDRGV
jgi:hypothetical protein